MRLAYHHCFTKFLTTKQVMQNFIPPLLEAVLGDYQTSIPEARDSEVLATMATIVAKLKVGSIVPCVHCSLCRRALAAMS